MKKKKIWFLQAPSFTSEKFYILLWKLMVACQESEIDISVILNSYDSSLKD